MKYFLILLWAIASVGHTAMVCNGKMVDTGDRVEKLRDACGLPANTYGSIWTYKLNGWTYIVHLDESGVIDRIDQNVR